MVTSVFPTLILSVLKAIFHLLAHPLLIAIASVGFGGLLARWLAHVYWNRQDSITRHRDYREAKLRAQEKALDNVLQSILNLKAAEVGTITYERPRHYLIPASTRLAFALSQAVMPFRNYQFVEKCINDAANVYTIPISTEISQEQINSYYEKDANRVKVFGQLLKAMAEAICEERDRLYDIQHYRERTPTP